MRHYCGTHYNYCHVDGRFYAKTALGQLEPMSVCPSCGYGFVREIEGNMHEFTAETVQIEQDFRERMIFEWGFSPDSPEIRDLDNKIAGLIENLKLWPPPMQK